MKAEDNNIYLKTNDLLKRLYGKNSCFRDGQSEAIVFVISSKRTLVIEKICGGIVYFVATKLLKEMDILLQSLLVH